MSTSDSTCWTVIPCAAAGGPAARDALARRYPGVVRAYLAARWRGSDRRLDLDDAGRVRSFRAFLCGVVRNVARRFESRPVRAVGPLPEIPAKEEDLSRLFERSWAQAIM